MKDFALLMIDFQCDFCAPGGYSDKCGGLEWVLPIIPHARRLLDGARDAGIQVVHTLENYAADLSDCPPLRIQRSAAAGAEYGAEGPLGRFMIRGEAGNMTIEELAPIAGELIFNKPSYGAFYGTALESELRSRGIQRLAIAGVTADVCVHTTLREATDRGFECFYVRDAISTFDPDIRMACENMVLQEGGIWGNLVTVDDMIELWA